MKNRIDNRVEDILRWGEREKEERNIKERRKGKEYEDQICGMPILLPGL